MKFIKIVILAFAFMSAMPVLAERKPVDIDWTRKGLDIDFPQYKYETRRARSEFRKAERMPNKITKQAFREMDRSINRSISRKMDKWFN